MKKKFNSNLYSLSFKMKKELQQKILSTIINLFIIFVVIIVFLSFVIFPVCAHSSSMHPDISKNSLLFVTPLQKTPCRSDVFLINKTEDSTNSFFKVRNAIVQFFTFQKKNFDSNSEQLSNRMVLRRVIGLPGDTVYMKDFMVYIKEKDEKHFLTEFELCKKLYNIDVENLPENWDTSIGLKSSFSPVVLGPDQYLVLADNRFASMDSRFWGVIDKSELVGKALVLYFPFSKFKLF